jgi:transposase
MALRTMINLKQYGLVLRRYAQSQNMSLSAKQAGVDRKTARKYVQTQVAPDQQQKCHAWRTRPDPLVSVWPLAERMLQEAPELEAKALFEHFLEQPESGLEAGHLRTFQRRVNHWRGTQGPDQEVYFPQRHCPGELLQLDWTHAQELGVTILGQPLDHLLCHCVLTHSNWEWAQRCQSESFLSLVGGLQAALGRLGKTPRHLGTDNSSAATHEIGTGRRDFNPDYLDLCEHYGLLPVTINVACPHEQGDVESQNGHLKRRIKQHLLLRGSRDFVQEEDYDRFLEQVMEKANKPRLPRLAEDLALMKPLPGTALAEYREVRARVGEHSTIRVKKITYSVPSRLIGQWLRVEVHESILKLYLGRQPVLELPRARGDRGAVINFRDMVAPMLRKPGAFLNYQHREQLYPTVAYRAAYDRLVQDHGQRPGVIEYLHLLKLAIDQTVEKVEGAMVAWMSGARKWGAAEVRASLVPAEVLIPPVAELAPDLERYDQLISRPEEVAYVH